MRDRPVLQADTDERAINLPAIAGHDDRFLTEIAPFRVANCLGDASNLRGEGGFIDVSAFPRQPRLNAEDFARLSSRRMCSRLRQSLPDACRLFSWTDEVIAR